MCAASPTRATPQDSQTVGKRKFVFRNIVTLHSDERRLSAIIIPCDIRDSPPLPEHTNTSKGSSPKTHQIPPRGRNRNDSVWGHIRPCVESTRTLSAGDTVPKGKKQQSENCRVKTEET
jgi:hypothetical protein